MSEKQDASRAPATEWLAPGAALNRFAPPQGMTFVASKKEVERVRYGFRVGNLGLLINPDTGSEAMPMPAIFSIPNAAPWLRGMLNLRGNLVPVFDLANLFSMPRSADSQTYVLVLDKGQNAVGIIIDAL